MADDKTTKFTIFNHGRNNRSFFSLGSDLATKIPPGGRGVVSVGEAGAKRLMQIKDDENSSLEVVEGDVEQSARHPKAKKKPAPGTAAQTTAPQPAQAAAAQSQQGRQDQGRQQRKD